MPTLSVFFGIIITMYREKGGRHNLPHLHAEYQGDEVVVSFDGDVHTPQKIETGTRMGRNSQRRFTS